MSKQKKIIKDGVLPQPRRNRRYVEDNNDDTTNLAVDNQIPFGANAIRGRKICSKLKNVNNSRGITLRSKRKCNLTTKDKCSVYPDQARSRSEDDLDELEEEDPDGVHISVDQHEENEQFPFEEEYESDEEQPQPAKRTKVSNRNNFDRDFRYVVPASDTYDDISDEEISFKKQKEAPQQSDGEQFSELHSNPAFETFIKNLVAQEMKQSEEKKRKVPAQKSETFQSPLSKIGTPKLQGSKGKGKTSGEFVKSPSDTTIYAPALARGAAENVVLNNILGTGEIVVGSPNRLSALGTLNVPQ